MRELSYLDLSHACLDASDGIGASVWPVVAKSISGLHSLRTVLLHGCDMASRDTASVTAALRGLSGLRRVDLRDNTLRERAARAVQEMRSHAGHASGSGCFVLT